MFCRACSLRRRRGWVRFRRVATTAATSATLARRFKCLPYRVTTESNLSPERSLSRSLTRRRQLQKQASSTPITSLWAGNADARTVSSTLNLNCNVNCLPVLFFTVSLIIEEVCSNSFRDRRYQ